MGWERIGSAGRSPDSDDILIQITVATRLCYRVIAADAARVLGGHDAPLYAEGGELVGDIGSSASGRMLIGGSRAGRGFLQAGTVCPIEAVVFAIPRDHLRAHYYRDDGPVDVLGGGD